MIRSLRKRHLAIWFALAAALPIVFIAGLSVRRAVPNESRLPLMNTLIGASASSEFAVGAAVAGRLTLDRTRLELQAAAQADVPDVLVYLVKADAAPEKLPPEAQLLGPLAAGETKTFTLPEAQPLRGRIVLYSRAHDRIAAQASLPETKGAAQ